MRTFLEEFSWLFLNAFFFLSSVRAWAWVSVSRVVGSCKASCIVGCGNAWVVWRQAQWWRGLRVIRRCWGVGVERGVVIGRWLLLVLQVHWVLQLVVSRSKGRHMWVGRHWQGRKVWILCLVGSWGWLGSNRSWLVSCLVSLCLGGFRWQAGLGCWVPLACVGRADGKFSL